jgi:hypothetical protein
MWECLEIGWITKDIILLVNNRKDKIGNIREFNALYIIIIII